MNSTILLGRCMLCIVVLISLNACKKNLHEQASFTVEKNEEQNNYSGSETILGKKMRNPYTVENIRKALVSLQSGNNGSRINAAMSSAAITATHKYLRFKPNTVEDVIMLDSLGYELSDVPFDQEIEYLGDWYHDPSIPVDQPTYLYTALPINEPLPPGIMVTQLAELYLFTEENNDSYDGDKQDEDPWVPEPEPCIPDPSTGRQCPLKSSEIYRSAPAQNSRALQQAGINPLALYNEAMRITGNEEEIITEEVTTTARRYSPKGHVLVQDNTANVDLPLRGATVKARRWFNIARTHTNADGYFQFNRRFRKKATLLVKMRSGAAKVRGINGALKVWQYVFPLKKNIGLYSGSNMERVAYTFRYNNNPANIEALNWVAATAMNTVWDIYQYCQADGLPLPPANLNIWVSSAVTNNASAPMLRRIATTSTVSKALDYVFASSGNLYSLTIKRILQSLLPDVTYRYGSKGGVTQNSIDVSNNLFYELSHSIHYQQVGNGYWTSYLGYVLLNGGYGNKTTSGS